jgi:hypothetical protein
VCYYGCQLKYAINMDDSLDAFGLHAVGGAFGGIMVCVTVACLQCCFVVVAAAACWVCLNILLFTLRLLNCLFIRFCRSDSSVRMATRA